MGLRPLISSPHKLANLEDPQRIRRGSHCTYVSLRTRVWCRQGNRPCQDARMGVEILVASTAWIDSAKVRGPRTACELVEKEDTRTARSSSADRLPAAHGFCNS